MAEISTHFTDTERRCSCGNCDGAVTANDELLEKLEAVRTLIGQALTINSWCRCADHNKAVGGKDDSAHLTGQAVDIRCESGSDRWMLLGALRTVEFKRIGVGASFIHADVDSTKPQRVVWTYA
jgi:zinc D-Ala-D-Ala carboxypeptidase